jgi:hypothetical protein
MKTATRYREAERNTAPPAPRSSRSEQDVKPVSEALTQGAIKGASGAVIQQNYDRFDDEDTAPPSGRATGAR